MSNTDKAAPQPELLYIVIRSGTTLGPFRVADFRTYSDGHTWWLPLPTPRFPLRLCMHAISEVAAMYTEPALE